MNLVDATAELRGNRTIQESLLSGQLHPSGLVTLRNATMKQLIQLAYKEIVSDEYLTRGPDWLDSDRFDLVAKAPPNTSADTERVMIQPVLAQRFHLSIHREQKAMAAYALVAGKRGPKLQPAASSGDPECGPGQVVDGRAHLICHSVTMAFLADRLPGYLRRPVKDLTDIKGTYDFQLTWAGPQPSPTLSDALDKDLGLKLEERKFPMPVIVIDRVDRVPTEN
jgi:uncharacterized protein (TIGR03435 family)